MKQWIENLIAGFWNHIFTRRKRPISTRGLDLGVQVSDDGNSHGHITIPNNRRAEHFAVLGRTGSGKSSFLKHLSKQDIETGRGFLHCDLHGDTAPFLLSTFAAWERVLQKDLSEKLIIIEPADPEFSVGLNPLEREITSQRFVQVSDFAQVLRKRWNLDSFGARTDELLRNSLFALAESGLTLLELSPFLSHPAFRAKCLQGVSNAEIRQYFVLRYDQTSQAMQTVMREPILNKVSTFTAAVHFRHIVGQQRSTFSIVEAMDRGHWIILNLHKGRLGEQAATLGSLFLATVKNALFSRKNRDVFTLYCDEIQNLVAFGSDLETVLSESRKFGISVVSSNQFLDQLPPEMRSAILAIGTHVLFQLSSVDAQQIATALDGGKPLAELLKNLPRRHMVVKTGHERWREGIVPFINEPKADFSDLYDRCRKRWARRRDNIEQEIAQRQSVINHSSDEVLNEWE